MLQCSHMKRILFVILTATVSLLTSTGLTTTVRANDLNAFTISSYHINYHLSRDNERRSMLTTNEIITAEFPAVGSVNHGIERYIPTDYDGHSTSLNITAVQDGSGANRHYTTYQSGDYTVLRIGDADAYVYGSQTYNITYQQRDVTKFFADTGRDEFYWDTNGTAWAVPINSLDVQLKVDADLVESLSGHTTCYQGQYQASTTCILTQDGATLTAAAKNLAAGDNITVAVGFHKGTFGVYQQSLSEKVMMYWQWLQLATLPLAFAMLVIAIVKVVAISTRRKELGTIIPEYTPPANASVTVVADMVYSNKAFAAQLVDLAVRHFITIYETRPKSLFRPAEYTFKIMRPIGQLLRSEEQEILKDLFGTTEVGREVNTKDLTKNISIATKLRDNPMKTRVLMDINYGLKVKDKAAAKRIYRLGHVALILGIISVSIPLFVIAITIYILGYSMRVLTDEGLKLKRYLLGLKMYISVAEIERLRMLQSPEGAEKSGVDPNDSKQMVKLYERLLPYAILFGQEKEWNQRLGQLYESSQASPDWFSGSNFATFSAVAFAQSLNTMTTSINSSGASSSSSGGSGGGGFSGGGGGGGGGGGW